MLVQVLMCMTACEGPGLRLGIPAHPQFPSVFTVAGTQTLLTRTAGLDSLLVWGFPDSAAVTCGSLFPHEFWRSELLDLIPD